MSRKRPTRRVVVHVEGRAYVERDGRLLRTRCGCADCGRYGNSLPKERRQ